jgi:hypothetical protein
MRMRIVMEEHYTSCQHATPFVLNDPTLFFLCFAVHFWHYCGPLLHEFHHQHSFPILENSCHQFSGRQTTFVSTFSACLMIVCASTALTPLWPQHSQMKPRFYHLLLVQCDWEIHYHVCGIALNKCTKAEVILCVLCAPVSIFWTHLAQNLW